MTHPRTATYLYATWISRYLTGDKSCLWACWFKANYQGFAKMPSEFDSARWNTEHTDLLNELVAELEERGCELFIERQNTFRVESPRSGAVIDGKPDLIAVFPDGRTVVYDVTTGKESASHIVQVQLYMYLLPRSDLTRWRGTKFEGAVVYADGHQVDVPTDSIDDAFVARLTDFMQKMTSDMPPRRVASLAECGFCELTKGDCPDRASTRLCDGAPEDDADISSEALFELRDARRDATLCSDCQDRVVPRDVHLDLYGMGMHTTAHLYSVPVLEGFDPVRNCSHCRRSTDDDCKAWRKLRKAVTVLRQECRWYAKGVAELLEATGDQLATIYEYHAGAVA